jgi:CheY-like chemotaxis protein
MNAMAPTVYFIDDSATMREVIKIAFRRENINVVACHDAASAIAQMDQLRPDVIISDVIMPDQDGYQVCEYIKRNPRLGKTPVILMSGVVNRAVADRAFAVKADELIRKPFQPQDLIARVRHLLSPRTVAEPPAAATSANAALSSIFATSAASMSPMSGAGGSLARSSNSAPAIPANGGNGHQGQPALGPFAALSYSAVPVAPPPQPRPPMAAPIVAAPPPPAPMPAPAPLPAMPVAPVERSNGNGNLDLQKMKVEILRLGGLVRKLQSELQAEREYSHALEAHIKTLQEAE